jgi:saccharopine dehydrogenase-like NADP-dependent oxidoreductase
VPRKLLHALLEPKVTFFGDKDLVVIRIKAIGEKDGKQVEFIVELIDYYDDKTGFTSMERTTGWDISIVAIMMAHGKVQKGAIPVELAIPGDYFVSELKKRGFNISVKKSNL